MVAQLEDIPAFLRLSTDERKVAWEKFRVERKTLPPEQKPYRPINDGAINAPELEQS